MTDTTYDPASDNIDDVKAHLAEHPEERDAVLAAEREGQNRVTLISWLEDQDEVEAPIEPATPGVIKSPDPLPDGTYPNATADTV